MSDPVCRNYRELLGVYVVGAIEPNERSMLDAHLNQCYGCREELASLAVLPALLHRIPVAEAVEIAQPGPAGIDPDDPAPHLLTRLTGEVRARRRTRRLRALLAAAAVIVLAAGGGAAVSVTLGAPQEARSALDVVTMRHDGLSGTVKYGRARGGTEIWTRVTGVPVWTQCRFWVTTADGRTQLVGGWLAGPGSDVLWYPTRVDVRPSSIVGFTLTWDGRVLLHFPAS